MVCLRDTSRSWQNEHWKILAYVMITLMISYSFAITCENYRKLKRLPGDWPCSWNYGLIPFVYDFYSSSPKRLMRHVQAGLNFIERNSCMVFSEHDPVKAAKTNLTYLYFTYSAVLEDCCYKFYTKPYGRRVVLVTPLCTMPSHIAHATLHALGLTHPPNEPFHDSAINAVMNYNGCQKVVVSVGGGVSINMNQVSYLLSWSSDSTLI